MSNYFLRYLCYILFAIVTGYWCEDETEFHSADSSALCTVRITHLSCYTCWASLLYIMFLYLFVCERSMRTTTLLTPLIEGFLYGSRCESTSYPCLRTAHNTLDPYYVVFVAMRRHVTRQRTLASGDTSSEADIWATWCNLGIMTCMSWAAMLWLAQLGIISLSLSLWSCVGWVLSSFARLLVHILCILSSAFELSCTIFIMASLVGRGLNVFDVWVPGMKSDV